MKLSNSYQRRFPNYADTPKAVIAAIAFSFAMRLREDDFDLAAQEIRLEWKILNDARIVPQKAKP